MKIIAAISGGVDSIVMLHKLVHDSASNRIIVAHVDHGIRESSSQDAAFVRELAAEYGLEYREAQLNLGPKASEERARDARYGFLRQLAAEGGGTIYTAHHANDVVETVAINLERGTSYRGLANLSANDIKRPLLDSTKAELKKYALANRLEWREDETNQQDVYLRNRLRKELSRIRPDVVRQICALRATQLDIVRRIDKEVEEIAAACVWSDKDKCVYSRYFFIVTPTTVSIEVLRYLTDKQLTRPQLERALIAVKTYNPGKVYQAGAGVNLYFSARNFTLELIK